MKARKEHRVPLSNRMIEILDEVAALNHHGDLVFSNPRSGKPYSDSTFSKLFRELEIPCVPHGMRSCFKNWTRDELPNPDHVMAEIALAHEVGSEVEQAYGTSDMFEKAKGDDAGMGGLPGQRNEPEQVAANNNGTDMRTRGHQYSLAEPHHPWKNDSNK